MDVGHDEDGISFDMSPDEADELALYLSAFKAKGNESKTAKKFREKLFGYCNSRPEYHRKLSIARMQSA